MGTQSCTTPSKKVPLELWFDLSSNYSYIAIMRIEEIASTNQVNIALRPFLLGPIFKSFGWDSSPFIIQKTKGDYVKRDMQRQCSKYNLPWSWPSVFPRRTMLAMRVAVYGQEETWALHFSKKIMLLNFVEDKNVNSEEVVSSVLNELELPASKILEAAYSDLVKQKLREQTEQAFNKGIFGAPMFIVGNEMFWGNDRLEDAVGLCREMNSS